MKIAGEIILCKQEEIILECNNFSLICHNIISVCHDVLVTINYCHKKKNHTKKKDNKLLWSFKQDPLLFMKLQVHLAMVSFNGSCMYGKLYVSYTCDLEFHWLMVHTLKSLILYVYTSSQQYFNCMQADAEKKLNFICTNVV